MYNENKLIFILTDRDKNGWDKEEFPHSDFIQFAVVDHHTPTPPNCFVRRVLSGREGREAPFRASFLQLTSSNVFSYGLLYPLCIRSIQPEQLPSDRGTSGNEAVHETFDCRAWGVG